MCIRDRYGVCTHRVERAREAAAEYGASRVYETMEQAFADPEVDIVVNLTRPMEHFDVTMKALQAGKHVYTEKPLGATLEEGRKIRDFAASKGLKVAGAPDTFLGGGLQTCRKLIDDGFIGTPLGASAFMTCRGHERWQDVYKRQMCTQVFHQGEVPLFVFAHSMRNLKNCFRFS